METQTAAVRWQLWIVAFGFTYLCMAVVIALPALIFWRVPKDISKNVDLRRRSKG